MVVSWLILGPARTWTNEIICGRYQWRGVVNISKQKMANFVEMGLQRDRITKDQDKGDERNMKLSLTPREERLAIWPIQEYYREYYRYRPECFVDGATRPPADKNKPYSGGTLIE